MVSFMMFINKATPFVSYEEFKYDTKILGSLFLSLMKSWIEEEKDAHVQKYSKYVGLIEESIYSFRNDVFNLMTIHAVVKNIMNGNWSHPNTPRVLYLPTLLESYFLNLRTILDSICPIILLSIENRKWGQYSVDNSLNALIGSLEKRKKKTNYTFDVVEEKILELSNVLARVKDIRDSIVHYGEEIRVSFSAENNLQMEFKDKKEDCFLLLKELTNDVLDGIDKVAESIIMKNASEDVNYRVRLVAFEGNFVPDFVAFLLNL